MHEKPYCVSLDINFKSVLRVNYVHPYPGTVNIRPRVVSGSRRNLDGISEKRDRILEVATADPGRSPILLSPSISHESNPSSTIAIFFLGHKRFHSVSQWPLRNKQLSRASGYMRSSPSAIIFVLSFLPCNEDVFTWQFLSRYPCWPHRKESVPG
jgi:hypothetical protein